MSHSDSPLHIAIRDNNIEIANLLLSSHQCDIHATNAAGQTPLQLATQMGNAAMINLLFQYGAGNQPKAVPSTQGYPPGGSQAALLHAYQRKQRITFWAVLSIIGYFVDICTRILAFALILDDTIPAEERDAGIEMFGLFWIIILPIYWLCFCMFLYRIWEEVPKAYARTTPGKAAILSLIPIFNWYWWSVAFTGLFQDMNKTTASFGLGNQFGLIWIRIACIFWLVMIILQCFLYGGLPTLADGLLLMVITIPTYWFVRNKVHKFIDIKSSVGR